MTQEFETITVYLPISDRLGFRDRFSDILGEDVIEWLNERVGPQAPNIYHFIANLDNSAYGWCFGGRQHSPESSFTAMCYAFTFKDPANALIFKMMWGGA